MTGFIVASATMTALCLVIVLVPLWRREGRSDRARRRETNIEVYRQRCAEIEREVAAARVPRSEAEAEKNELGARLVADVDDEPALFQDAAAKPARPWMVSVILTALIVAGGAGAYWRLGNWQAVENRSMPNFDQTMASLNQEIEAHPNDRFLRLTLAQTQQSAGRYNEAAHNFRTLNQATDMSVPRLLSAEAEARMAAGGQLSGRAGYLFVRLLRVDPSNHEALWFLGLRASEAGHNRRAIGYWQRLLRQKLPDDVRVMVAARRDELAGKTPKLRRAE